ncbi:MAG: glucokinase, partial [Gammaproteobacteria bacterium]|nr:glucokinase [Gammaproteobacteria bacterium]
TTRALAGVYIGGGMMQRYPERLSSSAFRTAFENKGCHKEIMEKIPTILITHSHPGLLGAGCVANSMLKQN